MNILAIIAAAALGFFGGWMAGTWSEHRLWLNAICGREKIWKAVQREDHHD